MLQTPNWFIENEIHQQADKLIVTQSSGEAWLLFEHQFAMQGIILVYVAYSCVYIISQYVCLYIRTWIFHTCHAPSLYISYVNRGLKSYYQHKLCDHIWEHSPTGHIHKALQYWQQYVLFNFITQNPISNICISKIIENNNRWFVVIVCQLLCSEAHRNHRNQ